MPPRYLSSRPQLVRIGAVPPAQAGAKPRNLEDVDPVAQERSKYPGEARLSSRGCSLPPALWLDR